MVLFLYNSFMYEDTLEITSSKALLIETRNKSASVIFLLNKQERTFCPIVQSMKLRKTNEMMRK